MKKLLIAILLITSMAACTENSMTKNWGGHSTVTLPVGHRLVTATWKEASLWYLTEPMPVGYTPSNKTFIESSPYGQWEGTVTFVETK